MPVLVFDEDPLGAVFGYRLHPEEQPCAPQRQHNWFRPHHCSRRWNSSKCGKNAGKDGFQVTMDVQEFTPNEITVKAIDNSVIVEARHEEKKDQYGHVYRHFVRRIELPNGFDVKDVISTRSCDDVLTIKAPQKIKLDEPNQHVIHVHQTGPAYMSSNWFRFSAKQKQNE